MDIKQLLFAAAGCLSYLVRATPSPSSTEVGHRSTDKGMVPTGHLGALNVAPTIPPYMQKIITEVFEERDHQQAKERAVESNYDHVDLTIGGESLFREKKQTFDVWANPIVIKYQNESALSPIPVRTSPDLNRQTPYTAGGVGIQHLSSQNLNYINGQLDANKDVLCNQTLAVRGYSSRLDNSTASPFSYIGCRPDGSSVSCVSDQNNCSERTGLILPLLDEGKLVTNDGIQGEYYNFNGVIYPYGVFRLFPVGGWGRTYVSNQNLTDICEHVKDLCADYLRGCRDITQTFTVTPTMASSFSTMTASQTSTFARVTSSIPRNTSIPVSTIQNFILRFSVYQSCPPIPTTTFIAASSKTSEVSPSVGTSSAQCEPVKETVSILQETPVYTQTSDQKMTLAAGAVGSAGGSILTLAIAAALKLCSNKLKKHELEITAPIQSTAIEIPYVSTSLNDETGEVIYATTKECGLVDFRNYPQPGDLGNQHNPMYGRVRMRMESECSVDTLRTDRTASTNSTVINETDTYLEMSVTPTVASVTSPSIYSTPRKIEAQSAL